MIKLKSLAIMYTSVGILLCVWTAQADVRLPHVFSSHMVLQQNKPITIWGWADPGEAVKVQVGEASQETKATDKGEWRVTLPALKAATTPLKVTVTGLNTITLDDVLVGEVWLCSGQSNMEMGIAVAKNAAEEVAAANYPNIRLLHVPETMATVPQSDVDCEWKVCSPENIVVGNTWAGATGFSATAYYFGRELYKTLNVPIGLMAASWGGTRIEPWVPEEGFASVPDLKPLYDTIILRDPRSPGHLRKADEYIKSLEEWSAEARKTADSKQPLTPPPTFPQELAPITDAQLPTALYNGMIHPLQPIGLRGIIWYQGESNRDERKNYIDKTRALVDGWHKTFNQDDLAYYYTLIAPYEYGTEPSHGLPEFWEAQAACMSIPNTGMAVTTDIGDIHDIHPKNKQEVGRRLAQWALAKTYGKTGVVYSGPIFKSFTTEGDKIRLTFDHVGGGLISRDGKPLTFFELIDADQGGFVPATAMIEGETVVISSSEVKKPVAFRFAWTKIAEPNFANKEGLPAVPFRGGTMPDRDALRLLGNAAQGYEPIYDMDFSHLGKTIGYTVDHHAQVTKPFDRIGYLLELTTAENVTEYIFVSMNAFTQAAEKIGVPTFSSGASFQQKVENMTVVSNVPGIVTGTGISTGNIEFWPNNYAPDNTANIPNASSQIHDFGDQKVDPVDGYGCMQVHNYGAMQTLFAFNHWGDADHYDLGIGNAANSRTDWTFADNGTKYPAKRLRVFVHYP